MSPQRGRGLLAVAAVCALLGAQAVQQAVAQTRSTSEGSSANSAPAEYRLGGGDVLRITVYQNLDLLLETRVSEAGIISYPLLGNIRIGGLSVTQAEKVIADGLKSGNFIKNPQVTIAILQVKGNQASVLGQVNRPGRFPIETADMRLTDLLANAGGVAPTGGDQLVLSGVRAGKPFRAEIDLPTIFASGGENQDLLIQNGDVIWVDRAQMVYIYGEVQRPGPMRLERRMTLMQTLASGGGLNLRGTEKGIRVHRKGAEGKVQVLQLPMDEALKDGDVVYVRESLF
jgi:polysaccharide export outer membrane protein